MLQYLLRFNLNIPALIIQLRNNDQQKVIDLDSEPISESQMLAYLSNLTKYSKHNDSGPIPSEAEADDAVKNLMRQIRQTNISRILALKKAFIKVVHLEKDKNETDELFNARYKRENHSLMIE